MSSYLSENSLPTRWSLGSVRGSTGFGVGSWTSLVVVIMLTVFGGSGALGGFGADRRVTTFLVRADGLTGRLLTSISGPPQVLQGGAPAIRTR